MTVFQSPVPGTKRLLGLGCSRKMKPFCPFRLFAGPVDPNASIAGFRIAEFSAWHNHGAKDQGEWVPRKVKNKGKKRKLYSLGDISDEEEDGAEMMLEDDPLPLRKAVRTSVVEASPGPSRASTSEQYAPAPAFTPRPSPLSRSKAVASNSNAHSSAPPLFYFNQPAPQTANRPPAPAQQRPTPYPPPPTRQLSQPHPSVPAETLASPHLKPFSTVVAEWTTFLTHLEPSLTYLAHTLASPSLGCTPALFFSKGTDDEMRMKLLERVEGIALWPRMILMERVATSGRKVWSEMGDAES